MVNCPECGNQISSNAGQCVHCGSKFTYCPECQRATAGVVSQCTNCGYKFAGNIASDIRRDIEEEFFETQDLDLFKAWQKSMPHDKKILTGFKYIKIILNVFPVVLIVIAVIILMSWKNFKQPLEQVASVKGLQSGIQALIVIACILEIFGFMFDYAKQSFVQIRCANWLKKQKFDCVEYINQTIRNRGEQLINMNDYNEFELFTQSAFISYNPSMKSALYAGVIIRLICSIAFMTCLGVFAMQTIEDIILVELYSGEYVFRYGALIASGVAMVIHIAAMEISDALYKKKYKAWEEKFLTAYKEI